MKLVNLILILVVPFIIFGQSSTPDELAGTVVFLYSQVVDTLTIDKTTYEVYLKPKNKNEYIPKLSEVSGTGFFVSDSANLFLVTANHVATSMRANGTVVLRTEGDKPVSFPFTMLIGKSQLNWVVNDVADVAVLNLQPSKEVWPHLKGHFIPLNLLNKDLAVPPRDIPLLIVGFPLGLGIQEYFSPITKESKTSSGLLVLQRFDNKKLAPFYLLDSPSVGGFSGAPLFEYPGAFSAGGGIQFSNTVACVGLIHGTISDDTGGKFAAVVPSSFIVETINKARTK